MKIPKLRSPHDKVGGLVHFGRMLDKIRLHRAGQLPADYHANLGKGFDDRCCDFLGVKYEDVVARVKLGGSDEDIFHWCSETGQKRTADEITMFNAFLRTRGWRDDASARLAQRLQEAGFTNRPEIQTFFDMIDADEEHPIRMG